jgi:hypothetical protein
MADSGTSVSRGRPSRRPREGWYRGLSLPRLRVQVLDHLGQAHLAGFPRRCLRWRFARRVRWWKVEAARATSQRQIDRNSLAAGNPLAQVLVELPVE